MTWEDYVKEAVKKISEGVMYMHATDSSTWPLPPEEFNKCMLFVNVLVKMRHLYQARTEMILGLFYYILNYDPTAPEEQREKYKREIYDLINIVKSLFGAKI